MKLIFEALGGNRINESVLGIVALSGIALAVAGKLINDKIKKVEADTKDRKEKMLIGLSIIDNKPIDYKIKPDYNKFENGYIKELIYRNVTNMNKAKEFSKKNSMSVKKYISIYKDSDDTAWLDKYKKFEKNGFILISSGGGDDTIIDSGKLYYIDHETEKVTQQTFEEMIADNWEAVYDALVDRGII